MNIEVKEKTGVRLTTREFKKNPIEEYFKDGAKARNTHSELFDVSEKDIDTKTDLDINRIVLINTLHENDLFLMEKGLKPVFRSYYEKHLRLLISKDRKSRTEYVDVNKNKQEDIANSLGQSMLGIRRQV